MIQSAEYFVDKNAVRLYVYRKQLAAAATKPRPVLFLVHGSTVSGRSTYDLQVPGRDAYSVMDHFAAAGWDVWTVDHEGYGRSGWTDGNNCNVADGARDLAAVIPFVLATAGVERVRMFGTSSGALRASMYVAQHPGSVERLAISALVFTGEGSPTLEQRRQKLPEYTGSHRRAVNLAFYQGMFNRDKPGTSESVVPEAIAAMELPLVSHVPTGTYVDMCSSLPLVDPKRIRCPVLVMRGEYDGIAADADVLDFFAQLPTRDKQYVLLSGIAHNPMMGVHRRKYYHALRSFLEMPL